MCMKFTRSNGPLLSVIIPSRQRFDALSETINSFTDLADSPEKVEFLVKLDSDDETISKIGQLPGKTKTLVYDRMKGYKDLHHFVNDLCLLAKGDWLLLMNDDAKMVTKGWDTVLENVDPYQYNPNFKGTDKICLLHPGAPENDITIVFPMIRKESFKALGHFSLHAHNDAWIHYVFEPTGAIVFFPDFKIKHYNNEVKDATRLHSASAQETSFKDCHDDHFVELRKKDTETLIKFIGE